MSVGGRVAWTRNLGLVVEMNDAERKHAMSLVEVYATDRESRPEVILADYVNRYEAALVESEKRREKVEEALRRITNYLEENRKMYSGGNMGFVDTGRIERWAREAPAPGEGG